MTSQTAPSTAPGLNTRGFFAGLRGVRPSYVLGAVFFRGLVLIADYLLIASTAMAFLPLLGAWLHRQSGLAFDETNLTGIIAMWLMPLLFVTLVCVAAELVIMRALWRWSSARIAGLTQRSTSTPGFAPAPLGAARRRTQNNTPQSTTNRKGSK